MTQSQPKTPLISLKGVLVLEISPQGPEETARILPFAPREAAGQLALLIARDLEQLFPSLRQAGIILPGAIYDQTEILTAGFEVFQTLETMYVDACARESFEAQIISLGSVGGEFPVAHLQPASTPMRGPLLLIPFAVVGPENALDALDADFDDRLLHEGECAPEIRQWLVNQFQVTLHHVQYLSLAGLCALTQTHLSAAGLDFLWQLLEIALTDPDGTDSVTIDFGLQAHYHQKLVTLPFATFALLARQAGTQAEPMTAEQYTHLLRRLRQAALGLAAHGMTVAWQVAPPARQDNEVIIEPQECDSTSTEEPSVRATLVEQNDAELGTVAWVLAEYSSDARLLRRTTLYPLSPNGLTQAHDKAKSLLAAGIVLEEKQTAQLIIAPDGCNLAP